VTAQYIVDLVEDARLLFLVYGRGDGDRRRIASFLTGRSIRFVLEGRMAAQGTLAFDTRAAFGTASAAWTAYIVPIRLNIGLPSPTRRPSRRWRIQLCILLGVGCCAATVYALLVRRLVC
jgi:hypothetical protein